MNKILVTFFTLIFCLTSSVGWSLEYKDLVVRDKVYYKKFTEVPFTGKVDGQFNGSFKNGKKDGSWVEYSDNGQLASKGEYKNGKEEGSWVEYSDNGKLASKGELKNGKEEGSWVYYHENGKLFSKGEYKNGKEEGSWVEYHENGKLSSKCEYKNGMGSCFYY